jgi:two-component system, sensor histidine kinase YesM
MFKHTIRRKIFIYISSLIMLSLIIISIAVYLLFFRTQETNETKYAIRTSDNTKLTMEFVLNLVNNTGISLGANKELLDELKRYNNPLSNDYTIGQNKISTLFQNIISVQEYIKGIHVLNAEGSFYTSNFGVKETEIKEIYNTYMESNNKLKEYFTSVHYVTYYLSYKSPVISYIRPIFSTDTQKLLGVIIVDIDYELLKELFTISSIQYDEKVLILGTQGETIFTYPYNIILDDVVQLNPILLQADKIELYTKVFGKDSIIVSSTLDYTSWKIIRVLSSKKVHQNTSALKTIAIYLFIAFIFISLLSSFILSSILTSPIKELNKKFKLIEKGDLTVSIKVKGKDEIGELNHSFNNMVQKLKMLISSLLSEQQKKSDMEFQILQAQINPHFLYNTLDSIKWLAVIQNVDTISDMTTALINLLKYNISKNVATVSLSEELGSIVNYIKIQKYRFGDIFDIQYNIEEETKELQILRFILQPIVENAIIHGFECVENQGIIVINSRIDDANLIIEVIDNGAGMDGDTLNIITMPENFKKKFNAIGVQNVQDRIKVYFGEKYGLSFESKLGEGTKVTLTLPTKILKKGLDNL